MAADINTISIDETVTPALDRIDLPGGYYFESFYSALAGRVLYRLAQPDGADFCHVVEDEARAFVVAITESR